jgi:PAS domain S-box-containing protein
VSISKKLYESIKEFITSYSELGYSNVAEFCKEAIRDKLSELRIDMRRPNSLEQLSSVIEEIRNSMYTANEDAHPLINAVNYPFALFSAPYGSLVLHNKAFEKLSGYERDELMGMRFIDFVVPEDLPRVEKNFWMRLNGEKAEEKYSIKARHKTGKIIPVELLPNKYIKNGKIVGVGVLIRELKKG